MPACGTGQILDHLADASRAAAKIVLADLSAALLAVARARAKRAPHLADGSADVEVVRADVQAFSPPPGTVDLVLVTYALTMIPDPAKALATMWASLKEGGILGIADFTRLAPGEQGRMHAAAWRWLFAHDGVHLREGDRALAAALPGARVIVHEVDWGSFPFVPELGGLLTCPYYVLVLQKGPVSA